MQVNQDPALGVFPFLRAAWLARQLVGGLRSFRRALGCIRAWTLASNTGYTVQNVWGKPRFGLQADIASGGSNHGPLMSFDPLFPKFAYFTEAAINAPINLIDAYPSVTIQPTYNFAVMAGVDVLWRYSRLDAF